MKICVYGAGAVGGRLAVHLSRAGAEVSVIARGAHGRAIRRAGLALLSGEDRFCVRLQCEEDATALPAQDVVIVTVKGPGLPAIAEPLKRMAARGARVVFVMNGVPWWFADGLAVTLPPTFADLLDPGARLRGAISTEQLVWGVVYSSNEVVEPGVVRSTNPTNRLILGRPDGAADRQIDALVDLLARAGYEAKASANIRQEVWIKMRLIVGASTVSALTGGTLQQLIDDPSVRQLVVTLMREAAATGRRLGFEIPDDIDNRLDYYRDATGPVRPSMLQDFDRGREPEIENGILAFSAIAAAVGQAVPAMDLVATLIRAKKAFMNKPAGTNP